MHAVITGGGTSGHVIPALAVIESLVDAGHPVSDIAYVGGRRGVETSMVPATGVTCEFLPITGLRRSFAPRSLAANLALPWRLVRATAAARRLLRRWGPRVVVSVGGYASEPTARAAVSLGIPLVCVCYDAVPGLATRRQSRRAAACAVAIPGTGLPRAIVTGAPVRRAVFEAGRATPDESVRASLGAAPGAVLVFVVGGSLGSESLNRCASEIVGSLAGRGVSAHLHHVTGPRYFSGTGIAPRPGVTVSTVAREENMPAVLAASDIVVTRAGASTVAEIVTLGVASVVVPWPGAAGDHQSRNAEWLALHGAAIVVTESEGFVEEVTERVASLATDPRARRSLADAARTLGEANRSGALARLIDGTALA